MPCRMPDMRRTLECSWLTTSTRGESLKASKEGTEMADELSMINSMIDRLRGLQAEMAATLRGVTEAGNAYSETNQQLIKCMQTSVKKKKRWWDEDQCHGLFMMTEEAKRAYWDAVRANRKASKKYTKLADELNERREEFWSEYGHPRQSRDEVF